MAIVTEPIVLDKSLNTTEQTPRNIADVLAQELSRITGRNASQVEYDNTESGLTADNVQDALDEIVEAIPTVPSVDIQTAVDEFSTYNGGLLSSLKVALSPNQDLHGYSEPWVGGASDNLLPLTVDGIKALNTDGTWSGNVYTWRGITYTILTDDGNNVIGINSNGTASERGWLFLAEKHFDDNDVAFGGSVYASTANYSYYCGFTNQNAYIYYNSSSNKSYILIANGYTTNNQKWYPIVRTKTTEAPTFSPYTNICPITGHTQVDVDVSDGQTTQEQITVNLGGTYYSGTLDVVSGVLTVDKVSIKGNSITWIDATAGGYQRFRSNATLANAESNEITTDLLKCSKFDTNRNALDALDANGICIYSKYIYVRSNTTTSLADFQTLIADADICYKYATPTPIQLSPTMVKALVGENHLSAPLDGQEITESEYRELFTWDEVEAYVNAHSGGSAEHEYSTTERVVGKWINGKTLYERVFTGVSIPNNSYTSNVDLGVLADEVIKVTMVGTAVVSSNTIHVDMIYAKVDNGVTTVVHPTSNIGASLPNAKIAIQYTKTTD